MNPILSVVMSTYNRAHLLNECVDSVLNQSFSDFEFIIIDDASTDNTCDVLSSFNDSRIKLLKNKENKGCTFNYHVAQNLAKGKYIAHIDDDDISLPCRLEKEIKFLNENADIALVGSFIETFGENKRPSWVFYTESDVLGFVMNFYNPICHSSVMYDKSFMEKHNINYDINCRCAQDYDFYKQILLKGGKLANISDVLVRYRMHPKRLTDIHDSQQIQINVAEQVKNDLLSRFLSEEEIKKIKELMFDFPYNNYDLTNVLAAFDMLKNTQVYSSDLVDRIKDDIKNNLFKF